MKKKNIVVVLVLALVVFAAGYWLLTTDYYKGNPQESPKTETAIEHQGNATDNKNVQAEVSEQEEPPTVEIPLEKQQLIGVKTEAAVIRPMQKIIRTVGRIEYDERRITTVNTKIEGWIEKLYVDYTGKYVKKGDPLVEIYSPELIATQQEFINALKWAKQITPPTLPLAKGGNGGGVVSMLSKDAEAIIEAARQRLRLWDITEEQIKKIEDTGKPIRTLTIYSPASGNVIQKMALQGMRVMPGEKLFDIADLSIVWILADIYEYEMHLMKTGQTAKITLSYFPGREFSSTIDYIYPSLAGETRTAKVRFSLPNHDGKLKPQMFTDVAMKIDLGKRLSIPDDAVIDTGIRQIVYVDKGEGYFEPREIKAGLRADGMVEVLKGLKPGEKVASAATFLIDSEAQLKGVKPLEHKH